MILHFRGDLSLLNAPLLNELLRILGRIKWYSGETKRVHSSLTSSKEETYKKLQPIRKGGGGGGVIRILQRPYRWIG